MKENKSINPLENLLPTNDKILFMIEIDSILSKVRMESLAIPKAFSELPRLLNSDN